MNIIVCLKQVPDTTDVRIDPATNTLVREGVPAIVNPFDENGIEEALRLKEKYGGSVTAICMGPLQAQEALRSAIALGVDEVILICDRSFAGSDTWATSYTLSQAIKKIGSFDLIICGKQAIDGDTAQVGPGIAEWLNIPQITFVYKINEIKDNKIIAQRLLEDETEVLESPLPAVITVVKQINEPRMPSLKGQMKAKKAQIPTWTTADFEVKKENLGLEASPTRVVKIFNPPARGAGEMLTGSSPDEIVEKLVNKLKEQKVV